jgi:hypothetical protein
MTFEETIKIKTMSFDGTEGAVISKTDAKDYTERFRNANPGALLAQYMGRDLIDDILAQQGCVGIRVYKGLNANNEERFIFVGVDADEDDMVNGVLAQDSLPCPAYCSQPNILNGY